MPEERDEERHGERYEPVVLSVVIPMYNEEEALPALVSRLRPVLTELGVAHEVVAVDDGSGDRTAELLAAFRLGWPELRVVALRRNSGHQAALTAGLDRARGAYVVSLDADLQDPPEKIPDMLALARAEGLDIVYGVRADRSSDSGFKRWSAGVYYRLMRRLAGPSVPAQAGDFRLLSRAAVDALKALPDQQRVYRLLVPWLGFPSGQVTYERAPRTAGRTKYPLGRMIRLAVDSVTGFSAAPLRLATWLGVGAFVVCLGLLVYTLTAFVLGRTVPGWTSLFTGVVFIGAVQLICVGLLGEYVGRIYTAVQNRPTYFVRHDTAAPAGSTARGGAAEGVADRGSGAEGAAGSLGGHERDRDHGCGCGCGCGREDAVRGAVPGAAGAGAAGAGAAGGGDRAPDGYASPAPPAPLATHGTHGPHASHASARAAVGPADAAQAVVGVSDPGDAAGTAEPQDVVGAPGPRAGGGADGPRVPVPRA